VVVGTPLMTPLEGSITKLAGKPDALHVLVPVPPLAARVAE